MCVVQWLIPPFAVNCRLLGAQQLGRVFLALELSLLVGSEFANWFHTGLNLDLLVGAGLADLFVGLLDGHFTVFWED